MLLPRSAHSPTLCGKPALPVELISPAHPFFLEGATGLRRLALYHAPSGTVKGCVLYIHPWCEEMNKARRMAATQARALAQHGYATLQVDLTGCGDSSGDFGDATWEQWIEDVVDAAHWLSAKHDARLWLWGLRSGCLLACAAARRLPAFQKAPGFLFWQPVAQGKLMLQQFLRLTLAGALSDGSSKSTMAALRERLNAGQPICVAGYDVNAALAAGLESATLAPAAPGTSAPGTAIFFEISASADDRLSPAFANLIENWRAAGHRASAVKVQGPAFWQTTEIEDVPALLDASLAGLRLAAVG